MELHLIALIPVRKSALSRVQTHSFFCFYMSISKEINTSPLLTHTQARLEQQAGPTSAITHRIHRFIFSNQLQFSSILINSHVFLAKKTQFSILSGDNSQFWAAFFPQFPSADLHILLWTPHGRRLTSGGHGVHRTAPGAARRSSGQGGARRGTEGEQRGDGREVPWIGRSMEIYT